MRKLRTVMVLLFGVLLIAASCASDTTDDGTSGTSAAPTTEGGTDSPDAPPDTGVTTDTVELTQDGDSTLDSVKNAGEVKCGTRDALPGFAVLQDDGSHQGFDSDFCRVIAAAVLGDAEAHEFIDLETADRFTALQGGEIDVLVRNTTWTAGRDGLEGATFVQPNFYDGQGMMVAADAGFASIDDMDDTVICSAGGTTNEGNVAVEFQRRGLALNDVLSFENTDLLQEAFQNDRCDGWTSDVSQLTGLRSTYPDGPEALVILPEVFSKEPLAPAVRDGDTAWAQAVNWAVFATIQAEEYGMDSSNVDSFLTSEDPNILKFLGVEVDGTVLDPGLGLPTDFAYQVVSQVGNYSEIFEEHLAPLGLQRGVNELWNNGGILYAPPYK
ncbi:MAG: amino acid ABC transporter substrate-binding protein [Acidimicrobiales bacterium]|nr:amino acid ABC transporter substrate-binding protein [Acidimicrobiales bacterium]